MTGGDLARADEARDEEALDAEEGALTESQIGGGRGKEGRERTFVLSVPGSQQMTGSASSAVEESERPYAVSNGS